MLYKGTEAYMITFNLSTTVNGEELEARIKDTNGLGYNNSINILSLNYIRPDYGTNIYTIFYKIIIDKKEEI